MLMLDTAQEESVFELWVLVGVVCFNASLETLSEVQFTEKLRDSRWGVPLVFALSPLVFKMVGGLGGRSTPNSCGLLAGGSRWPCGWLNGASPNNQMQDTGLKGQHDTELYWVWVCIYLKDEWPYLWQPTTDVNAFFIRVRLYSLIERLVFLPLQWDVCIYYLIS